MTSKVQKKFQKKKEREKKAHERVLARRSSIRADAKKRQEEFHFHKRVNKLQKELDHFGEYYPPEIYHNLSDETIKQLEHNIKILKTLESEWQTEQTTRAENNEILENQGHMTLEEKIHAAHQKLMEEQREACGVPVKTEDPVETAEVTILKATPE